MADTKRLQAKKRLTTWLEGITPANGFVNDLTGCVFRGRDKFGENDPLVAVAILEPLNPDRDINSAGSGRMVQEELILLIQGWAAADVSSPHPTDAADNLMGEVKKRVGQLIGNDLPEHQVTSDHNLGGLVDDIRVEPGTVRPPDQFSALAYFYFRVVLSFTEKIDDPFGV